MVQEIIELSGHLIDSDILRKTFARIVEEGGEFEVLDFSIGKTNEDVSQARLLVRAKDSQQLDRILESLSYLGASSQVADARFVAAERDGILPDEFYSTTNFETFVRIDGTWQPVRGQKMDCALVLREGQPTSVKQRLVKQGEAVVLRGGGVRVVPPARSRSKSVFGFMSNEVSSETNKVVAIAGIAREMQAVRAAGAKIVLVAGPAIVHSGGDGALARLVRAGWIDVLLSGNAFATHDVEKAILKTSLGVCQLSGRAVEGGNRNHLFAINAVNRQGGVSGAVESGLVSRGVMYEIVRAKVPFVLAGSIRDDGPLVDVITDVLEAQLA
jgi:lysine-ketoglutarate reductase/saccharopine dehydrogenase-like protein (TIGR00300 family)